MKIPLLLFSVAMTIMPITAQEARQNEAKAFEARRLSPIIDPDSGVFDISFGTPIGDFIKMFGEPTGNMRLSDVETALFYGRHHAFLFRSEKLSGVRINSNGDLLDWRLSSGIASNRFDNLKWRLNNGIENDMKLTKVKQIVGEKLVHDGASAHYHYSTEKALVELEFAYLNGSGAKEATDAHLVYSITVRLK